MYVVKIEESLCVGCGECVNVCPVDMFSLNGDKAMVSGNMDECLGCESCVSVCQQEAVTVTEM